MGGDVKGQIEGPAILRSDAAPTDFGYFRGIPLFDGDLTAVVQSEIEGRDGRGHIKRHLMVVSPDGHTVGADFVGDIAVGRDAVGTHHDEIDFALGHERSRGVIGDQGMGNAQFHKFPGGEAGALQNWPGLVHKNMDFFARLPGSPDNPDGSAVAACGQTAGVAVS